MVMAVGWCSPDSTAHEGLSTGTRPTRPVPEPVALSDLALAAFCPRKLYYARTRERPEPPGYETADELSTAYAAILDLGKSALAKRDIPIDAATYVSNLESTRDRLDAWEELVDPAAVDAFLVGKSVRGRADKVLEEPLAPSLVTPGEPPPEGVWKPQSVRAVGAAKALAWEREAPVERAYVEYARYGVVRAVPLTTRRKAAYRRTLRSVQAMDGPPPRLGNETKCRACEFAETCGVRTRSLRSLL